MRKSRATRDLAVIAALLVLAFVLASALEVFEWLFSLTREHEGWQVDELFTLVMLSALAFAVFAGRRWRELDRENARRERAEKDLRESEERNRSLVQNASDIITILEPDGTVRYQSPAIERVLGYRPEEMVGKNGFGFVHPEDLGWLRGIFEARTKGGYGGVQPPAEVRARHADGSWRYMEMVANYLLDDPNTRGVVVNARDVTERRKAEERIRWLASFPEKNPNLVIEADLDGALTYANPAADERFPDLRVGGVRHPMLEGFKDIVASLQDGEEGGLNRDVEVEGSLYYQTVTYIPESGVVRVYASDITKRRRAEAGLLEAQRIGRLGSWEAEPASPGKFREEHGMRWSDEMFRILGFVPQEFTPTFGKLIEATHPQDRGYVSAAVRECVLKGEPSCTVDHRILRPDGQERFVQARLEMVYGEGGELVRNFGTILDITERQRAEEELRRSEWRLAEAQRIAHVGNWEFDVRENRAYWSDEMFRIFGLSPQQFIPDYAAFLEFVHPDDKDIVRSAVRRAMYEVERSSFEYRILRPNGEERTVHADYEVVRDADGKTLRIVGTAHDITERKALERELEHQAFHDALTELPNRALFMDRLRHALSRSPQQETGIAVLFLDLDNFKVANDSLGHEVGDRLLVAVAGTLRGCLSPEDTVARFGGDEFCVLLEHVTGFDDATKVARRILATLREPQEIGAHEVAATASIGIAFGSPGSSTAEDLIRKADLTMYRAKSKGKARYELFDPAMNTRAVERLRLETELRRALREEEFEVHYQPLVNLENGAVVGVEALVRWRHPRQGLVSPGEFVPLAEETGLIVPIGYRVLSESCRRVRDWREDHPNLPPLTLSVNLSARQFQRPELVEEISGILKDTGLDPESLTLEITETVAMEDEQATFTILRALKALGVKVAIDDFGTGYSSLAYLKRFPVDILKVDRTFVVGLGKDPEDDAIARAIVAFARALSLDVVAEGIESERQATLLLEMGCELGQGYHFARPRPLDAALGTVEEMAPGAAARR